jgi:hypothetical protein
MKITRAQFDTAVEAVWSEIQYQNQLPIRTEDGEAKDPAAFATLGRVYLRRLEEAWCNNAGFAESLPVLRKLAAIFVRGMIYNGITFRAV